MSTIVQASDSAPSIELVKNKEKKAILTLKGAPRLEGLWSFMRDVGWHPSTRDNRNDDPTRFQSNTGAPVTVDSSINHAPQQGVNVVPTSPDKTSTSRNGTVGPLGQTAPAIADVTQSLQSESTQPQPCGSNTESPELAIMPISHAESPPTGAEVASNHGQGPGLLDVQIRYTIRERLEQLEFASKLGLKADMSADFMPEEMQMLRDFSTEIEHKRLTWFHGSCCPTVIFRLVALKKASREGESVSSESTEEGTGITIIGLHSEDQIRGFHKVMSKKHIPERYSPLRLCYDTAQLQMLSRIVAEKYEYGELGVGLTLCGTQIVTERQMEDTKWTSTIGGIIAVDNELFAITSSHRPSENLDRSSNLDSSDSSTAVESDYHEDVKPALILDYPSYEGDRSIKKSTRKPMIFPDLPTRVSTTEESGDDQDWRLIPISQSHCLPNSFQYLGRDVNFMLGSRDFIMESSAGAGEGSSRLNATSTAYITDRPPQRTGSRECRYLDKYKQPANVWDLASLPKLPFDRQGTTATEVWVVTLKGSRLQTGDSGAWVIDERGLVVGAVTAASGSDVYITPFHLQKREIEKTQPTNHRNVSLPSPLQCFLELASSQKETLSVRDGYVSAAISSAVLEASMRTDSLALALFRARELRITETEESRESLRNVLGLYGNGIRQFLSLEEPQSASVLHGRNDDQIMRDLRRMYRSACREIRDPEVAGADAHHSGPQRESPRPIKIKGDTEPAIKLADGGMESTPADAEKQGNTDPEPPSEENVDRKLVPSLR
ncbi:hypothetical protein QBC37DRAFT_450942 [Rhypophila decipiens]|uniref:Uncharacterized protein n=1 Tax=Rhypophila decipiens TaxID=261697 RepID=A0AAN6XYW1_9PEZI|nr:hypothetical protein QBC37DRAFT_450942 [Rhypophila decipiens]